MTTSDADDSCWPSQRLRRRARWWDARAGRLIREIQLLEAVHNLDAPGTNTDNWRAVVTVQLQLAKCTADQGRIDDSWEFLHCAERYALNALDSEQLRLVAISVREECDRKLSGWRRASATKALPDVEQASISQVMEATRILHGNSQNSYLRLRLLGARLVVASTLLVLVVIGLGVIAGVTGRSDHWPGVLFDGASYTSVALLGALGALLSFAIGTLRPTGTPRIYELATGLYATTVARVVTGSAAAVIAAIAVEARVLSTPIDWVPAVAVVAGFSERFVRRIVETLSASAEKPVTNPGPPTTTNQPQTA